MRGKSHRIAVEIGLKEDKVMTLEQLTASLLEKNGDCPVKAHPKE